MKSTAAMLAAMRDPQKWKLPANASILLAWTACSTIALVLLSGKLWSLADTCAACVSAYLD
jgi:hypothetical protein